MLSAISWDGGGGNLDWNTAANWSTDQLPGPDDDVTINVPGDVTVGGAAGSIRSLTSYEAIRTDGGTLNIAVASSVASLTLNGGVVTGAGNLAVSGPFHWTGGRLSGSGRLDANGGMVLDPHPHAVVLDRVLNNAGMAIWIDSQNLGYRYGSVTVLTSGVFNNLAGATFDAQADSSFLFDGGSSVPAFNNQGTFKKSGGTYFTSMYLPFNNSGTVELQSGMLILGYQGTSTSSGSIEAVDATTLYLRGTQVFTDSSTVNADNVIFAISDATFAGSYTSRSSTAVAPGTVRWTGSIGGIGALTLDNSTADFSPTSGSSTVAVSTLTLNGTLTGTADIAVSGLFMWTGGTLSGSGSLDANGSMVLDPHPHAVVLDRVLNNAGTAIWIDSQNLGYRYGSVTVLTSARPEMRFGF